MAKFRAKVGLVLTLLIASICLGLTDVDRQGIFYKNLLDPYNGGFENGKSSWSITTDTFSVVTSGSNLLTGGGSATWNSAGAGRIFKSKAITIPNGLYGRNGLAQCLIMTPSGTATHTIDVYDGTNVLSSTTITSSTIPTVSGVNFVFPSSGTVQIRLSSVASDEPSITIDDCYLGAASNLSQASQAQAFGTYYVAGVANCNWTRTGATSFANFSADSDCGAGTITGNASNTAGKIPGAQYNGIGPGTYLVIAQFSPEKAGTNDAQVDFRLSDGTTNGNSVRFYINTLNDTITSPITVIQEFTYTTAQSSVTWQVQGATTNSSNTVGIKANNASDNEFYMAVYKFPSNTQVIQSQEQSPTYWAGYHSNNCSWARTNAAFGDPTADATCTFTERKNTNFGTVTSNTSGGNNLPGIVFTPKRAGTFFICAGGSISTSGAVNAGISLTDGTNTLDDRAWDFAAGTVGPFELCGFYNATSTASSTLTLQTRAASGSATISGGTNATGSANWTIFPLDQIFPAAQYQGSVTNSGTGQVRLEAISFNCDSAAVINSQINGTTGWTIGNISSGACVITIPSGVFSAAPYCTWTGTNNWLSKVTVASSTSVTVGATSDSGANSTSFDGFLFCLGAK